MDSWRDHFAQFSKVPPILIGQQKKLTKLTSCVRSRSYTAHGDLGTKLDSVRLQLIESRRNQACFHELFLSVCRPPAMSSVLSFSFTGSAMQRYCERCGAAMVKWWRRREGVNQKYGHVTVFKRKCHQVKLYSGIFIRRAYHETFNFPISLSHSSSPSYLQ